MKPIGNQVIAEFFNCSKNILNDRDAIEQMLRDGIYHCDIELIGIKSHCYNPIGITTIAVISESHVAIHTYPEAHHASLDIFTCSRNVQVSINLLEYFKSILNPSTTRTARVARGNPIEITDTDWITDHYEADGFDIRYHIAQEVFNHISKYQSIRIIENENFGRMLFLDNDLQISESDAYIYNQSMISPIVESDIELDRVAILGGGDGGVLYELLKHNPKRVTLIDIDEDVVKAGKEHLSSICFDAFDDDRVEILHEDAFKFLETNHGFNAVIYDLTMHPESFIDIDKEAYLERLFSNIKSNVVAGGIVTAQCCSENDTMTFDLSRRIFNRFFSDVKFTHTFIPSYCSKWIFASAINK